jgi:hypothetical protein
MKRPALGGEIAVDRSDRTMVPGDPLCGSVSRIPVVGERHVDVQRSVQPYSEHKGSRRGASTHQPFKRDSRRDVAGLVDRCALRFR